MATIKSTLALDDKMTPTLSKAERQAIANLKAYQQLQKQVQELKNATDDMEKSGNTESKMFDSTVNAIEALEKTMAEYEDGTRNAIIAQDDLKDSQDEVSDSQDKTALSAIALNQSLELLHKAWSALNTIVQEANELMELNNKQFNAQFTAAMKMHNVLGASSEEIQSMYDYASALQEVGVVGDEATISGMSTLSMYADTMDQVKQLTPAILDLAVAQEGLNVSQATIESYAQRVGYALNGNATMLKRLIGATDEEIKKLNSMNDKTAKAAYLYTLIERSAKDANETLAQTAQGGIIQADNALGDMGETLGEKVTPYFTQFKLLIVSITKPIVDFIAQNEWLIPIIEGVGVAIGLLIAILTTYTVVTKGAAIATAALGLAEGAALLPIFLVVAAIGILIGVLLYLWNTNDDAAYAILYAWDVLVVGAKGMALGIKTIFFGILEVISGVAEMVVSTIQGMANSALAPINGILSGLKALGAPVEPIQLTFADNLSETLSGWRNGVDEMISSDWDNLYSYAGELNRTRDDRVANRFKVSDAISNMQDLMTGENSIFGDVIGTDGNGGKALKVTSNDKLLSDDDIQLLLDVATRDYKLNYQQVTPNITLTFGDIRETADVDDILDQVADRLEEIYDSDLEVNPE